MNERGNPVSGLKRRLEVPGRHADVVLFGGEADLLERRDLAERVVAPGAGELAGDPGVRGLSDGQYAAVVEAQKHR